MDALVTSEGNRIPPLLAQMYAVIFWKGWVKFCPCLRKAGRETEVDSDTHLLQWQMNC